MFKAVVASLPQTAMRMIITRFALEDPEFTGKITNIMLSVLAKVPDVTKTKECWTIVRA